jgi:hypothetical protein
MPKKLLLLLFIAQNLFAESGEASLGIKGKIKNEKGEAMPFASVLVKGTEIGTMANQDGDYEIKLKAGSYEIVFQYIGYQSVTKKVDIAENLQTLNIVMKEISIELSGVKVSNNKEDPALTIMRKTIAMSPIHHKEVESYLMRSYLRGTFRVNDVSFLFEKAMKDNFIKKGQTYVLESVNEVKFKQPNSFVERVISIRSNLPPAMKNNVNASIDKSSFYNPNNPHYTNDPPWNKFIHSTWVEFGSSVIPEEFRTMVKQQLVLTNCPELARLNHLQTVLFFDAKRNAGGRIAKISRIDK